MSISTFFGFEKDSLKKMNKEQKKSFLSNDLIERMIRVEQRVSTHVGKSIHYRNTQFYNNLSDIQKKKFERHLKHKHKKSFLYFISHILFFLVLAFFILKITSVLVNNGPSFLFLVLFFICIGLVFLILAKIYERKTRHKRLSSIHNTIGKVFKR